MNYKRDKLVSLYDNKEWSDCSFVFARGERIRSHKLILALASPVFERMFYGDLKDDEVFIEDVDVSVFDKVLEYIYTERISMGDLGDAWAMFYVAQKYFLSELRDKCTQYIESHLTVGKLMACYQMANLFGHEHIARKCLEDIHAFGDAILLVDAHHVQPTTIRNIAADAAGIQHVDLLVLRWALMELQNCDDELSLENVCQLLKRHRIAVPMPRERLNSQLEAKLLRNHLDADAELLIGYYKQLSLDFSSCFNNNSNNNNNVSGKCSKNRKIRYRIVYKNCLRLSIRRESEVLSPIVRATSDCFLFGVSVATKSKPVHAGAADYVGGANVYVYLRDNEHESNLVHKHQSQMSLLRYDDVQDIFFAVPVFMEALVDYMVCIEYLSSDHSGRESVLLTYMSDRVFGGSQSSIHFGKGEESGGVLRGVCFYDAY